MKTRYQLKLTYPNQCSYLLRYTISKQLFPFKFAASTCMYNNILHCVHIESAFKQNSITQTVKYFGAHKKQAGMKISFSDAAIIYVFNIHIIITIGMM